jgi:hypothetical protein
MKDVIASTLSVAERVAFIEACICEERALREASGYVPVRGFSTEQVIGADALNAAILGTDIVGFAEGISRENMRIFKNCHKFASHKSARDFPKPGQGKQRYTGYLQAMEAVGWTVYHRAYTNYRKESVRVTMDNIVLNILDTALSAVVSKIPGVAALNAVASTTLTELKKNPEALRLFESSSKEPEGVKFTVLPCGQTLHGDIMASVASVDILGSQPKGGVLFIDWEVSQQNTFNGEGAMVYDPGEYDEVKDLVMEYLSLFKREMLEKEFGKRI